MGNRRPSIKDVAQKANVSIATVSHVLNKTRYVSDEITQRVMDALAETNYQSNAIAKALRQNKTRTIGVIIPDIINPFFSNLVNFIETELNEYGYSVILCHSRDDLDREIACINKLRSWAVDGMIIAPASPTFDYSELERQGECPIVFVDRRPNMEEYDGVFFDLFHVFKNATEELLRAGHKKIGFIHGPVRFSTTGDRICGYTAALQEHNISVCDNLIVSGETTTNGGFSAMEKLASQKDMTAVIVANSKMSLGVMRYLGVHRVKIPDELAVIGFETAEWAEVLQPALTSIRETVNEMGVEAAKLMLEILQSAPHEKRQVYLTPYMTERSSY